MDTLATPWLPSTFVHPTRVELVETVLLGCVYLDAALTAFVPRWLREDWPIATWSYLLDRQKGEPRA